MSEQFKIIYKILKILSKAMDIEEFDSSLISHKKLGISKPMWNAIMEMLIENGYIKGVTLSYCIADDEPEIEIDDVKITLKGLEYLEENSLMKKASDLAKGVIDIIK